MAKQHRVPTWATQEPRTIEQGFRLSESFVDCATRSQIHLTCLLFLAYAPDYIPPVPRGCYYMPFSANASFELAVFFRPSVSHSPPTCSCAPQPPPVKSGREVLGTTEPDYGVASLGCCGSRVENDRISRPVLPRSCRVYFRPDPLFCAGHTDWPGLLQVLVILRRPIGGLSGAWREEGTAPGAAQGTRPSQVERPV